MSSMDDINKPLRDAVAARLAATAKKEQLTGTPVVCMHADTKKFEEASASAAATLRLPADIPAAFLESVPNVELLPAKRAEVRPLQPVMLGATMPEDQLAAAWDGIRQRATEARMKIHEPPAEQDAEVVWSARRRIIGIAGRAGAGKNTAADMIPGAFVLGFADPLYAGLAAMLSVPEGMLRSRRNKEAALVWLGKSPRELMQTLGTEWGRGMVREDLWLQIAEQRMAAASGTVVFSDVRFDNEAEWIRNQGGEVWLVEREQDTHHTHSSEAGISTHLIDRTIDNRGTLEDLRQAVLAAVSA